MHAEQGRAVGKASEMSYNKQESQRRFEAALRGAFKPAPKQSKSMTRKRPKAQRKRAAKKG